MISQTLEGREGVNRRQFLCATAVVAAAAAHRVRDRLISRRTAVINQIRSFLLERGLVFAQTPAKLKAAMAGVLENADTDLTPMMRNLIDALAM